MVATKLLLNREARYRTQDSDEGWWQFVFGQNGNRIGWFVFYSPPGSVLLEAKGRWTEEKVSEFLQQYNHPIDDDAVIDAHVWLTKGGLEEFFIKAQTNRQQEKNELLSRITTENKVHWLGGNGPSTEE